MSAANMKKLLIANRGEIAVRIARTARAMGIETLAIYSEPDADSLHVRVADKAIALGGQSAAESYLRADLILEIAKAEQVDAVIPGYGFLSENTAFASACEAAGIAFVGPTPAQIEAFGLKHRAREIAAAAGVPLTPGTGLLADAASACIAAAEIGYPIMLKSTAGGGGIGLTRCDDATALTQAFESVQRMGKNFFNDSGIFLERYITHARHIEVQIFGDGNGQVIALGERDCSLQRRNQKVVEETPAPNLPDRTRQALLQAAVKLGQAVNYRSAGTVEFIYDPIRDEFYFLEVNTRLQVEHPITEAVTGVDLVAWMLQLAAGEVPALNQHYPCQGAAIEVRLYAEDPLRDFQPSPGELTMVSFPEQVRVDSWVETGTQVSAHYDPMLAKLIVHGTDRADAIARMQQALASTALAGIATNLDYLRHILASSFFAAGDVSTGMLGRFTWQAAAIEVIKPGTYSTVQDYPGRMGYWHIGVPPSGPMDDYAFRVANRIVGNHPEAAGMEFTLVGPELRFHCDSIIALTGAPAPASLDHSPIAYWQPIRVRAGQVLRVGKATTGCRTYLAVRNGIDVPCYLGSRSTFALGQFGGHGGRPLRAGDSLAISQPELPVCTTAPPVAAPAAAPANLIPAYSQHWQIGVLYGPHGAPDFFTETAISEFFATDWEVHYNSNRLGIRLIGPKPSWTRSDGGEAGLHPSNIHDTEYAVGAINFTGDMPVILTKDGPSLGGFVCPVTIVAAELWKVGQVKPGDRIRFVPLSFDQALQLEQAQDSAIAALAADYAPLALPATAISALQPAVAEASACITQLLPETADAPAVSYRQAGDKYILVEYGPMVLDLRLRLRVHALMQALTQQPIAGVEELSPGVRSLQIRYDSRQLHQQQLLQALAQLEARLPPVASMQIPTRVLHLPMAFEDSATLDAVARYQQSVRKEAPWLPSNTEFMRRINGLDSVDQVRDTLFAARYMVLGLGDVYLGAPCAVPVDPRHRLLTSKYNPARTFTAEGTVGIGGVYMCIYGMDSPGGYQLVGRTLPIWNKHLLNSQFAIGKPWLLRFFDQVCFYPVSETELTKLRADFRAGRAQIRIEEETFNIQAHEAFLTANADSIGAFRAQQQAAFTAEVARWQQEADFSLESQRPSESALDADAVDGVAVCADISGSVWKLLVAEGQVVKAEEPLVIIEAMKMEFSICAETDGLVKAITCAPGKQVQPGEVLLVMESSN